MSKLGRFIGVLAVVLATAGIAEAQSKKIAVRSFNAKGVDAAMAGILETGFCTALGNEGQDVICPDDLKALAQHAQIQVGVGSESCKDDDMACIQATAKAADAGRVVTGEVSKLGETFIVSVALLDAGSGKVLVRASDKGAKPEEMLEKLNGLAKKLAAAK